MENNYTLSVYTIDLQPKTVDVQNSNRWLFRNKTAQATDDVIPDSVLFMDFFTKFISSLDTPAMFSDPKTKKCMTAYQSNISDSDVAQNITPHSNEFIIEGKVEGGSYGKRRNKTNTLNKTDKSNISQGDAITDDFYFLLYSPINSGRSILMLQSYTDDTIDTVMKKFFKELFSHSTVFNRPEIERFYPSKIKEQFKNFATVSAFSFSTEVPGTTLLGPTINLTPQNYKVEIKIEPIDTDLPIHEYEESINSIQNKTFLGSFLSAFNRKKGKLTDNSINKTSQFDIGTDFEIRPKIFLSKHINFDTESDPFVLIKDYCFELLAEVKSEIYLQNAIQEH